MDSTKLFTRQTLLEKVKQWKLEDQKVVFTNGCFDVFHAGHAYILNCAKSFGDKLIVGLNSDTSVKGLKGNSRPVNNEQDRAYVLAALEAVDAVVIFEESTPLELIKIVRPDVLVKGGDYTPSGIVGANEVVQNGGVVKTVPLIEGLSSTGIIKRSKQTE